MTDLYESRDPIPICPRCSHMQEQLEHAVDELERMHETFLSHARAFRWLSLAFAVNLGFCIWMAWWILV